MRLEQDHEHEEPRARLPEPRARLPEARARLPEAGVTRNVYGQSLDEAQAAFRAEWEARLQEKRRQAERAKHCEVAWERFGDWIYLRGLIFGGGVGALVGLLYRSLWGALILAAAGGLAVGIVLVPLLVLGLGCKAWFGARARRLELELLELGRVELPREPEPDALLAFPAELQAEIREKRRQAEAARRRQRGWNSATWRIFCTGASTSVLLGLGAAAFTEQSFALAGPLTVFSALLTFPLLCLAGFGEWCWKRRAERLERELGELGCS